MTGADIPCWPAESMTGADTTVDIVIGEYYNCYAREPETA